MDRRTDKSYKRGYHTTVPTVLLATLRSLLLCSYSKWSVTCNLLILPLVQIYFQTYKYIVEYQRSFIIQLCLSVSHSVSLSNKFKSPLLHSNELESHQPYPWPYPYPYHQALSTDPTSTHGPIPYPLTLPLSKRPELIVYLHLLLSTFVTLDGLSSLFWHLE